MGQGMAWNAGMQPSAILIHEGTTFPNIDESAFSRPLLIILKKINTPFYFTFLFSLLYHPPIPFELI